MNELHKTRLRWQCRRGKVELDIILENFFEEAFDNLSFEQKLHFEELMEQSDTNIYAWLMGYHQPTEPHLQEIIDLIKNYGLPPSSY